MKTLILVVAIVTVVAFCVVLLARYIERHDFYNTPFSVKIECLGFTNDMHQARICSTAKVLISKESGKKYAEMSKAQITALIENTIKDSFQRVIAPITFKNAADQYNYENTLAMLQSDANKSLAEIGLNLSSYTIWSYCSEDEMNCRYAAERGNNNFMPMQHYTPMTSTINQGAVFSTFFMGAH